MKRLTNLSFIATAVVALGSSAAFADDSQLQNRLASQSAKDSPQTSTVALYSNQNGVSGSGAESERSDVRFELRSNAHGQVAGSYAVAH